MASRYVAVLTAVMNIRQLITILLGSIHNWTDEQTNEIRQVRC
jgi:hypothetical protein